MNNKEKLEMMVRDSGELMPLYAIYTLQYFEGVSENMIPPEAKKMKAGCEAFLNSFIKTLDEQVDPHKGIIKSYDKYIFCPNGMICCGDFYDLGLKPWEPSKKSLEEYSSLKTEAKTVAEVEAEASRKAAKKEAARLRQKQADKEGHIRLGEIKKLCAPVYWQLKGITSKNLKFPTSDGPSLATLVSQLKKCNSILKNKELTEQKRKMVEKLTQKYKEAIHGNIKPYIGSGNNIRIRHYCTRTKDFEFFTEYEVHCSDSWFNIIPGKEKEFFDTFKNLAAKAYQFNRTRNLRYSKISQGDIMETIMRYSMYPDRYDYNISKAAGLYSGIVSAAQLLERSNCVEKAIEGNNPNQKELTPFLRDFLIKVNAFDVENVEEESKGA